MGLASPKKMLKLVILPFNEARELKFVSSVRVKAAWYMGKDSPHKYRVLHRNLSLRSVQKETVCSVRQEGTKGPIAPRVISPKGRWVSNQTNHHSHLWLKWLKRCNWYTVAVPYRSTVDRALNFPAISSNTPAIALARRAKAIAPLTHQTQLIAKVGSRSRKVGLL